MALQNLAKLNVSNKGTSTASLIPRPFTQCIYRFRKRSALGLVGSGTETSLLQQSIVRVCVCVCERERERVCMSYIGKALQRTKAASLTLSVCVCVCEGEGVCVCMCTCTCR